MSRKIIPYEPHLLERARRLRREATLPERLLWSRLRRKQLGVRFLRQRPLGAYIVDFYAPDMGLVIEVDGRSHDARQAEHDLNRQAWLEAQGLNVVRVTNDDVPRCLDEVIDTLSRLIEEGIEDA